MNNDIISLKLPSKPEYVMVARLASAAVANRMNFDIDQIEDIKMAVAEAIILLINQISNPEQILIKLFVESKGIRIEILGEGLWKDGDLSLEDNNQTKMGRYILSYIMDKTEFNIDKGLLRAIYMYKEVGGQ
ncbi:MAG: hypothetical protein GX352_08465 [Clostridiales bacterium]|nr:hypothetical protein [Clostridiales bacterium]